MPHRNYTLSALNSLLEPQFAMRHHCFKTETKQVKCINISGEKDKSNMYDKISEQILIDVFRLDDNKNALAQ